MLALGLGLTAALVWAVHDFLARKLSQGAALLPIVLVVLGAGSVVLLLPAAMLGDWSALTGTAVTVAIAAGGTFSVAIGAMYRAFSIAPARIVSPIIGAYPLLTLLFAVAQGRTVTGWDWISVAAVVIGIAVVAVTEEAQDRSVALFPAMGWAALSGAGFAATFALGQEAVRQGSDLPVILITRLTALAVIGGLFVAMGSSLRSLRGNWALICGMGVMDAAALALVTASGGLPLAEYATVASSLFGVGTILLASYFLGERLRPVQWLGVAVVFAGIGVLSAQG